MYKQFKYIREGATLIRGGTTRLDLDESGLLSALYLKIGATCVSNATLTADPWRLQDLLTLVEIIGNGATVIKSLEFKQAQFINFLRQGIVPPHWWRNYATNTQEEHLVLLFGRHLGDPNFGLDLAHWDNVELRITNISSATYHADSMKFSAMAVYLRDHPGFPGGYLRSEEWRDWTTTSDETKYFILPTEFPIAGLYLRSLPETTNGVPETGFANQMDDIDFKIFGGVKEVYKGGLDDLAILNFIDRGAEVITGGHMYRTADYGGDISIGRPFGGAWAAGSKDGAVAAVIPTMEADPTVNALKPEAYEGDTTIEFIMRGIGFQNMAYLWFSQGLEPDSLLDLKTSGEGLLNIHTRSGAGYAGGTAQVVLERLVTG